MNVLINEVMTIGELAVYLKIPKSTLYKLARERKVPSNKIGRHWRFQKRSIDRWLEGGAGDRPRSMRGPQ